MPLPTTGPIPGGYPGPTGPPNPLPIPPPAPAPPVGPMPPPPPDVNPTPSPTPGPPPPPPPPPTPNTPFALPGTLALPGGPGSVPFRTPDFGVNRVQGSGDLSFGPGIPSAGPTSDSDLVDIIARLAKQYSR